MDMIKEYSPVPNRKILDEDVKRVLCESLYKVHHVINEEQYQSFSEDLSLLEQWIRENFGPMKKYDEVIISKALADGFGPKHRFENGD